MTGTGTARRRGNNATTETPGLVRSIVPNPGPDPAAQVNVQRQDINQILNSSAGQAAVQALAARQDVPNMSLAEMRAGIVSELEAAGERYNPLPNILDQYANYTYHIRWSLTNDIVSSNVRSEAEFQNAGKMIIAESGVTVGFNITEFEIDSICAPTRQTQAMQATTWKMTIKEPYGLSLIDRLYSAGQLMGVNNHLTAPSFIEVWFTGYDENGGVATPEMHQTIYKLFRVNVTKLDSETVSSGTTYRIEGVYDGTFANTDSLAIVVASSINIGPVRNLGEFFNELALKLNSQQQNLNYDFTRRVEYRFRLPPDMAQWQFSLRGVANARSSATDIRVNSNRSNPTITISRGMDINTILYFVLAMTEEGIRFAAGEERPAGSSRRSASRSGGASLSANGMANMVAIHSQQEIIGFDFITNDYVRRITYTFTKFETARAVIDGANVRATTANPAAQRNRLTTQLGSGRYSKAYEYIYTGRNLDIIRFDIKMEFFWQSLIPSQLGENTYSNWSVGPQQDQSSVANSILNQYRRARSRLVQAQALQARASSVISDRSASAEDKARARDQLATANRDITESQAELARLGNDARTFQVRFDGQSAGQQALTNIGVTNPALLQDQSVAQRLAAAALWAQSTMNRRNQYLEDVRTMDYPSDPLPVSFRTGSPPMVQNTTGGSQTVNPDRNSNTNVASMPRTRGLVAAILNDVTSSPYFVQVELEIRGDPYWLGLGNVLENAYIASQATAPPSNAAWFYSGDTGFMLTFRTGEAPNENTGYMDFSNTSVAFMGLYAATNIRSTFRDGKFTQTIKAVRDALQRPQGVPSARELAQLSAQAATNLANGGPL